MVLDWTEITLQTFQNTWQGFLNFLPLFIVAVIIFIIGWFISVGIGKLVTEILKRIKFNQLFEKEAWRAALEKAEIKVDASAFVGAIVKWILVILFLLIAVEILGLVELADFLKSVLNYLPNVVVAALIFVVTVILVDIVEKVVRAGVESIKVGYGHLVSVIVKWSIWIFAILAILHQLGIARPFMETLFTGLIAVLVIAGGLAFGLGGKDLAAELLQDLKKKVKK
ncbi:MAG: mechanosensitive ion channel family protein [Minisyncoccales bacterium]